MTGTDNDTRTRTRTGTDHDDDTGTDHGTGDDPRVLHVTAERQPPDKEPPPF